MRDFWKFGFSRILCLTISSLCSARFRIKSSVMRTIIFLQKISTEFGLIFSHKLSLKTFFVNDFRKQSRISNDSSQRIRSVVGFSSMMTHRHRFRRWCFKKILDLTFFQDFLLLIKSVFIQRSIKLKKR